MKRGELGIMGTELNSELAKAMKVDAQRGAFVSRDAEFVRGESGYQSRGCHYLAER